MSNHIPGPDHGGAKSSENAIRLQQIYGSYFNGLILGDASELSFVSGQLFDTEGYLPQMVASHADDLGDTIRCNGGYFRDDEIEYALCDGIRAYEYSAAPFNPKLVLFAVQRFNFDRTWLMDTVRPSRWVLKNIVEARTKEEQQDCRLKGNQAMGSLGLTGFFKRKRSF